MVDLVRKHVAAPPVPVTTLLALGALTSFGWLLTQDRIHPLVVYALQLYLSF